MTDDSNLSHIYIDSTIFIDAFEGSLEHSERLKATFRKLHSLPKRAVTSEYTLAEILGKVSDRGWVWQNRFYLDLIVFNQIFDLRPLSRSILIETGAFRKAARETGKAAKLGDAIHAVTALAAGCQYLFTCDKRFIAPLPMMTIVPDENGFAAIDQALDG